MLLRLALGNYFGPWEGYLVVISLGRLDGFIIGTGEGYLVGLSLVVSLGSPFESPNHVLTVIILGTSLRNSRGCLLDSIWYINCYGPCIGTWKFL